MTLQEAKSIARHLGLTLRQVRSGAYRVNFRDGNDMTAYYTDNLEDAVKTAVEMARTRDVTHAVDEVVAAERVQGGIANMPLNSKPPGRKWRSRAWPTRNSGGGAYRPLAPVAPALRAAGDPGLLVDRSRRARTHHRGPSELKPSPVQNSGLKTPLAPPQPREANEQMFGAEKQISHEGRSD